MNKFFYQAKIYYLNNNLAKKLLKLGSVLNPTDYYESIKALLKAELWHSNNSFFIIPELTIGGAFSSSDIYFADLQYTKLCFSYDFKKGIYTLVFLANELSTPIHIKSQKQVFKVSNSSHNYYRYNLKHGDLILFKQKCLLFYCPSQLMLSTNKPTMQQMKE